VVPGSVTRLLAECDHLHLEVLAEAPGELLESGKTAPPVLLEQVRVEDQDTATHGKITRVDLRLAEGVAPDTARPLLQPLLPAGVLVEAPAAAADQAANLSRAYRVNLTMLAAIALLTGGFLVFSAQALSVVRRRTEFAFLRALGLARQRLFAWLLAEGAAVGLAGGVLGVIVGHGLAWGALKLLGGDLGAGYFSGLTPSLQFQPQAAAIYVVLGLLYVPYLVIKGKVVSEVPSEGGMGPSESDEALGR